MSLDFSIILQNPFVCIYTPDFGLNLGGDSDESDTKSDDTLAAVHCCGYDLKSLLLLLPPPLLLLLPLLVLAFLRTVTIMRNTLAPRHVEPKAATFAACFG